MISFSLGFPIQTNYHLFFSRKQNRLERHVPLMTQRFGETSAFFWLPGRIAAGRYSNNNNARCGCWHECSSDVCPVTSVSHHRHDIYCIAGAMPHGNYGLSPSFAINTFLVPDDFHFVVPFPTLAATELVNQSGTGQLEWLVTVR